MSIQERQRALSRAVVAAESTEGWDATIPAIRAMLPRMADACDADLETRTQHADAIQRVMLAESQSFLKEPIALELFRAIAAFRQTD